MTNKDITLVEGMVFHVKPAYSHPWREETITIRELKITEEGLCFCGEVLPVFYVQALLTDLYDLVSTPVGIDTFERDAQNLLASCYFEGSDHLSFVMTRELVAELLAKIDKLEIGDDL